MLCPSTKARKLGPEGRLLISHHESVTLKMTCRVFANLIHNLDSFAPAFPQCPPRTADPLPASWAIVLASLSSKETMEVYTTQNPGGRDTGTVKPWPTCAWDLNSSSEPPQDVAHKTAGTPPPLHAADMCQGPTVSQTLGTHPYSDQSADLMESGSKTVSKSGR